MARRQVPPDLDGRGDTFPFKRGEGESFATRFMRRLRSGPKVAPVSLHDPNNESSLDTNNGSQGTPSIPRGDNEDPDGLRPGDKTWEAKKSHIRDHLGFLKFLRRYRHRKVVPLNGFSDREHTPPSAPRDGPGLLKVTSRNGDHAPDTLTSLKNAYTNGDAFSHRQDIGKYTTVKLKTTLQRNEHRDRNDADSSQQKCQTCPPGQEDSSPDSSEEIQTEQPLCCPDVIRVASKQLPEASPDKEESSLDRISSSRCESPTTSLVSASLLVKEASPGTSSQGEPPKSAGEEMMSALSSLGKTNPRSFEVAQPDLTGGTLPRALKNSRINSHKLPSLASSPQSGTSIVSPPDSRNVLDVTPDVLADEMRTLSPGARQRRIQEITAYIKRRVDLQTLKDLTSNTSIYTSNEKKEIEENADRAEVLLGRLKILIKGAKKRKQQVSSTSQHNQQRQAVHGHVNKTKTCVSGNGGCSPQNGASSQATQVAKVTPSYVPQLALPSTPKVPSGKSAIPTPQPSTKPSKSKAPSPCPAINKRTFRKSVQKQGSPAQPKATSSKDLQALGLPIIDEKDVQPVETKKGTPIKLGCGDYGNVYLMRSHMDGTLMAVKRLTQFGGCQSQDKRTQEMLREIRAMEAVKSCRVFPKFLGVLDLYSFGQEFVGNSRTMKSWSAFKLLYRNSRGPRLLPLDWVRICIDVTEGLDTFHRAGWTHNDLHVGNIMVWRDPKKLTATWEGKIIDLGKASRIKSPPPPKILTFVQMMFAFKNCTQLAPEIVEGRSRYNVKSDIYSLGIVLQDIAKENRLLSGFKTIGDRCVFEEPNRRPELKTILKELNQLCEKFVSPRRVGKTKGTR
ncbi:uncharacterized protein LOC110988052 [Acanthaster planci]|uniref:Uncharacterized protein LOC110988052 n=1 Tax=Acanthaster planci TaxID=133434 RepID=A0A8B7ZU06_ACAPL|nr:uncharacterized protein LOC110988052 [Acanthaster planci]